jgi:stage V sporulation protein D (sporulation-specific penicillin-binding protein)
MLLFNYVKTRRNEKMPDKSTKSKLLFLKIFFVGLLIVLIFRLAVIMLLQSDKFKKVADQTQFYEKVLTAHRGTIYSSDVYSDSADILAQSATNYDVFIDPSNFAHEIINIYENEVAKYQSALSPGYFTKVKYSYNSDETADLFDKIKWTLKPMAPPLPTKFNLSEEVKQLIESLAINLNVSEQYIIEKMYLGEVVTETEIVDGEEIKKDIFTPYDFEYLTTERILRCFKTTKDEVGNVVSVGLEDKGRGGITLKTDVEKRVIDEISAAIKKIGDTDDNDGENDSLYSIGSINWTETSTRYYPKSTLAAPVIGFMTADNAYGVELTYDSYLKGKDGLTITAKDANGKEMFYRDSERIPAVDGNDVYLTIDSTVQAVMEKYLKEMCDTYEVANRGSAIMMNVKDGSIIAMATYPSFDLNEPYKLVTTDYLKTSKFYTLRDEIYTNDDGKGYSIYTKMPDNDKLLINQFSDYTYAECPPAFKEAYNEARSMQWSNKIVSSLYTPGSVFKVFTGAVAIDTNSITVHSSFDCGGGITVAGTLLRCHSTNHPNGQSFTQALANSCNPAFVKIGLSIGGDTFVKYLKMFDIINGSKTGVDLSSEAKSITVTENTADLYTTGVASSAFGQTSKFTLLEMMSMCSTVINGGNVVVPHVVDKIVGDGGEIVYEYPTTSTRQAISTQTSEAMVQALKDVATINGTKNAYIKGYEIGGKSGTSQKNDEYSIKRTGSGVTRDEYVASYFCFAPAADPTYALIVMADQPNQDIGYYGSGVAVPCAKSIFLDTLPYLGLYPDYGSINTEDLDVTMPLVTNKNVTDVVTTIQDLGLYPEVIGNGETVLKQMPEFGDKIRHNGKVILYTESIDPQRVFVPDVVSTTLTHANTLLTEAGLNYVLSGASSDDNHAKVTMQSIPPGTQVEKYSVIEITAIEDYAD